MTRNRVGGFQRIGDDQADDRAGEGRVLADDLPRKARPERPGIFARHAGAAVVMVRVCWSPDLGDALKQPVDRPLSRPADGFPADFAEFPEDLVEPADILITKRQWGAFYGTELDLQLRRRGVRTLVLGGVATNFGVESTARDAWERGYEIVLAEDVTSSLSGELHDFSMQHILPRIGVISSSAAISFEEG